VTRRFLFAGPSLPDAAELPADNEIRILPPVAGRDLLRLPLRTGDVVGIVDGYFHQTHAVRHKEILAVLAGGVQVFGGASIGALRAAELDSFGMRGIGGIYADYRDGVLTADDEVALSHSTADSGYRPLSVPLVNIRATLAQAQRHGLLDAACRQMLIDELATLPYWRRTYRQLSEIAGRIGLPDTAVRALDWFCTECPVNRKRADALAVLDAVRTAPLEPHTPRFDLSRTTFLRTWEFRAATTPTADGESVSDLATLRVCQLFAADYPDVHRSTVLDRLAHDCTERCGTKADGDPAAAAIAHGVHCGAYPPITDTADFGFLRQWLTPEERDELTLSEQVVTFLVRSYRISPGIVDNQGEFATLRDYHALGKARELVRTAGQLNGQVRREHPDFDSASLSGQRIEAWFAERWHSTLEELPLRVLDRGLESVPAMVAAARPYFLLAKYNPTLVDFELSSARR
jgi:hypothetical protein